MDTDKITQVLYNIISNALKYSPEGGTVTYRLRDRGDLLEISVSDQEWVFQKKTLIKSLNVFIA